MNLLILQLLSGYLLVVNVIAFVVYFIDKQKAKKGKWRISEATLLLLAVFGGALGAWMGMRVFRHKTQHWKFRILVPLMLILWIAGLGCLAYKFVLCVNL